MPDTLVQTPLSIVAHEDNDAALPLLSLTAPADRDRGPDGRRATARAKGQEGEGPAGVPRRRRREEAQAGGAGGGGGRGGGGPDGGLLRATGDGTTSPARVIRQRQSLPGVRSGVLGTRGSHSSLYSTDETCHVVALVSGV
jgi:hypothetical protein